MNTSPPKTVKNAPQWVGCDNTDRRPRFTPPPSARRSPSPDSSSLSRLQERDATISPGSNAAREADEPIATEIKRKRTTKRGNGEGTIYKDGAYWVAEISWNDDDGFHRSRRKRKRQHEAIAALEKLKAQVRDGTELTGDRTKLTVADVMKTYLAEAERRVASRTLKDYRRISKTQIVPSLGKIRAHKLRRGNVITFLESVNGARSKQYAYTVLKGALAVHVRHADPRDHPFPPRSTPKVKRREYMPLGETEKTKLFQSFGDDTYGVVNLLMVGTGGRQSEILGLRWQDIGADHISIHRKLDESSRESDRTKTLTSRRRVDVPKRIVDALERHRARLKRQHTDYLAWKAAPPESRRKDRPDKQRPPVGSECRDSDLVFVNRRGKAIHASNLRRAWRALRKQLDLPDSVLNKDMRHEHGSRLTRAGVHPKVTQERLGHSSFRVTMDIYSHLMPGMQQQAVDVVDAMLVTPTVTPNLETPG